MSLTLAPIGYVRGGREQLEDDRWASVKSAIELDPARFSPDALAGLDAFSHLVVVYHFHKVDPAKIELAARHPRNNPRWPKVGIFSQRGKNRPNQLGVSTCKLLGVEGLTISVQGLDAIDGTPVLDLKPYFREFEPRGETFQPAWSTEIMSQYW